MKVQQAEEGANITKWTAVCNSGGVGQVQAMPMPMPMACIPHGRSVETHPYGPMAWRGMAWHGPSMHGGRRMDPLDEGKGISQAQGVLRQCAPQWASSSPS